MRKANDAIRQSHISPELPEAVRQFAAYKLTIQGLSALTVAEYERDLLFFFRFMLRFKGKVPRDAELGRVDASGADIEFIRSIGTADIMEFLYYTHTVLGNGARTRARKLSSVKTFFAYMCSKAMALRDDPAQHIDGPAIRRSLPKYLTLDESRELLDTADNTQGEALRDRTILTLFLNCGMRLSELVGIDMRDIDPGLEKLRVLGKRNKERIIYLNSACREQLARWLEYRRGVGNIAAADRDALFVTERRRARISTSMVQKMVKAHLDAAGLGNRALSTHKLRHTAATLMYQNGVDVLALKEILGHEQLNTTQIYAHVTDSRLREAMERNPLAESEKTANTSHKGNSENHET